MVTLSNKDIQESQKMDIHKIRIMIQMGTPILTTLTTPTHLEVVEVQTTIESHLNPTKSLPRKQTSKIRTKDGPAATRLNRMTH